MVDFIELGVDAIGFTKCLPQFFFNSTRRIDIKFLVEIGNIQTIGADNFAAGGFDLPSDNLHLGGFTRTIRPYQPNSIPWLNFPINVFEDFTCGINLADMFQSQHEINFLQKYW